MFRRIARARQSETAPRYWTSPAFSGQTINFGVEPIQSIEVGPRLSSERRGCWATGIPTATSAGMRPERRSSAGVWRGAVLPALQTFNPFRLQTRKKCKGCVRSVCKGCARPDAVP